MGLDPPFFSASEVNILTFGTRIFGISKVQSTKARWSRRWCSLLANVAQHKVRCAGRADGSPCKTRVVVLRRAIAQALCPLVAVPPRASSPQAL